MGSRCQFINIIVNGLALPELVNTRGVCEGCHFTYFLFRLVLLGLFVVAVARGIAECTVGRSIWTEYPHVRWKRCFLISFPNILAQMSHRTLLSKAIVCIMSPQWVVAELALWQHMDRLLHWENWGHLSTHCDEQLETDLKAWSVWSC